MKRWVTIVVVFLLAGAVVNVAVAWGCAVAVDPTFARTGGWTNRPPWRWEVVCWKGVGSTFLVNAWAHYRDPAADLYGPAKSFGPSPGRLVPGWGDLDAPTAEFAAMVPDPRSELIVEERTLLGCGWPLRAIWCESEREIMAINGSTVVFDRGFVDLSLQPWHGMIPRVLPLGIDWLPFAVNTLFYAALLWPLFCASFAMRRIVRMKRGRCVKCGYPMGESAVCSECGSALRRRVGA